VEVAFETRAANLAGACIQFVLIAQGPEAQTITGEVTLQQVADQPDIWEGVWQGDVPRAEVYELMLAVDATADNAK
jgi:hypothetical protein